MSRDTTVGRSTRIRGQIGDDRGFDICLQPSVKVPPSREDSERVRWCISFSLAMNRRDSNLIDLIDLLYSCHVSHISGTLTIFISLIRLVVGYSRRL